MLILIKYLKILVELILSTNVQIIKEDYLVKILDHMFKK